MKLSRKAKLCLDKNRIVYVVACKQAVGNLIPYFVESYGNYEAWKIKKYLGLSGYSTERECIYSVLLVICEMEYYDLNNYYMKNQILPHYFQMKDIF